MLVDSLDARHLFKEEAAVARALTLGTPDEFEYTKTDDEEVAYFRWGALEFTANLTFNYCWISIKGSDQEFLAEVPFTGLEWEAALSLAYKLVQYFTSKESSPLK
jgi:hypothetical protein